MRVMEKLNPSKERSALRFIVWITPLLFYADDFFDLLVTYLLLGWIAPRLLGDVAESPARFAALITLVHLPMSLAHLGILMRPRVVAAVLIRGDASGLPPARGRRRLVKRVRSQVVEAAFGVLAAVIVFRYLADPGDARIWPLVAATVIGSVVVDYTVVALFKLLDWWLRKQHRRT